MSSLKRNANIVLFESMSAKGINFINILLLTFVLSVADYGKYSYVFVSVAFLSAFFDLGMENTAIRFTNKVTGKTKNGIFGLYLIVKIIIMSVIIILFLVLGEVVFRILDKEDIISFLPYLLLGLLGESLFFLNDTYLQSSQKFIKRAIINISRQLVVLLMLIFFYIFGVESLKIIMLTFLIPFLYSLFFLKNYIFFFKSIKVLKLDLVKEIIKYEKWMVIVSIPNNILGRIDFFLIAVWASYQQLAIYNFGFQLSAIIAIIPYALGKVLLPHISKFNNYKVFLETKMILKKVVKISVLLTIGIFVFVIIAKQIVTGQYAFSISILQFMALTSVLTFISIPIEQVFYSIGKPKIIFNAKVIQIILILCLSILPWYTKSILLMPIIMFGTKLIYLFILYRGYKTEYENLPSSLERTS
ncbi:oligosaccharide flippase family protein [Exiguobacterium sp. s36]|uniref:lipopolysaccharide biosynthesis protein n=1 Tax=Exiguobacterium sp. s36 TaxID=2751227 RepID=UPI001BEC4F08|nr:oligosaccharide flippase family protein [Exiguobacterium sp. s36]